MTQVATAASATAAPPRPEEPLAYPITFAKQIEEDDEVAAAAPSSSSSSLTQVSLFSALHWLLPVYELAEWLPKGTRGPVQKRREGGNSSEAADAVAATASPAPSNAEDPCDIPYDDVQAALRLLPVFDKFFEESSLIIPQHAELCYRTESLTLPTPRGPKVITRSKVEGDHRAVHRPAHAPATRGAAGATTKTTVTNSTAYFSLLPGHNHFLVHYEAKEKLQYFHYLQLDRLRFAWVAVKELMEENKVFHLHDGSLTGFAKRDLKKNNAASPFCLVPSAAAVAEKAGAAAAVATAAADGGGKDGGTAAVVGRGGGNARLHQGTSGNVITAPPKELMEDKKRMAQLQFVRKELEEECQRRWPYTPIAKSCIFTLEEKVEAELPADALEQLGLVGAHNARNSKNGQRRGPRYYLATVELPLLNKKGGVARFKAPRWWSSRRDAESSAAEATLMALRNMKP